MHRGASTFTTGVEARHDGIHVTTLRHHDTTGVMGRDAAHLVVTGRHDRQRFLQAIDTGKLDTDFVDARQALHDGGRIEVGDVKQDVVLVDAAAATFLDFRCHGAGDHVTRRQILGVWCVALHEAFLAGITQDAAFAAHTFGNQHARTGHTGRVELPEFHVFERDAGTRRHTQAVTGIDEGIGRRVVDTAGTASGENRRPAVEDHDLAGFHFHRGNAEDMAFFVADQVQRHPFNEELGVGLDVALIHRVQHGVTGTVSGSAGTTHRLFAEVGHVTTERTLVNLAVVGTVERHAVVLELDHDFVGLLAHELDRVLVTEPVGTLDGIVHVPRPVVFLGITEGSSHPTLRRNGVRAGRKNLGKHGGLQAGFG